MVQILAKNTPVLVKMRMASFFNPEVTWVEQVLHIVQSPAEVSILVRTPPPFPAQETPGYLKISRHPFPWNFTFVSPHIFYIWSWSSIFLLCCHFFTFLSDFRFFLIFFMFSRRRHLSSFCGLIPDFVSEAGESSKIFNFFPTDLISLRTNCSEIIERSRGN